MQIKWSKLILDVFIVLAINVAFSFLFGKFFIQQLQSNLLLYSWILGIVPSSIAFTAIGCFIKQNRFKYLLVVGTSVWLFGLFSVIFMKLPFYNWLFGGVFTLATVCIGYGLSLIFIPQEQSNKSINNEAIKYDGGLNGFIKGTQSLRKAFWLIGVLPALILALTLLFVKDSVNLSFPSFMLLTFCLTIPFRLFAWLSIIRCINNTSNNIWSVLAGLIVAIDIMHKVIFWSMTWLGHQDSQHRKAKLQENIKLCATEVSKVTKRPVNDIKVQNSKNYPPDEKPYYLVYFFDNGIQYYKCRIDGGSATVEKR